MEYIHVEAQLCNKISIFKEKMIFDKAKSFVTAKYGEPIADQFESILADQHQISFVTGAGSDASSTSEEIVPVAAGAMTPA